MTNHVLALGGVVLGLGFCLTFLVVVISLVEILGRWLTGVESDRSA
ncbi:hypothetical protein [Prochlorothrix hollandica]|nr:hypothetical protein [Prochlorothrix hollandica]